jgi:hypothetical protein
MVKVFTVHEPPQPPADRIERGEQLAFVRDGFSWGAALFGPLWILANGLWLVLLGYLLIVVVGSVLVSLIGAGASAWSGWLGVALHLLLGLEAASLRRWTLERRGWSMVGSVAGVNREDAERRFFEAWLPDQPVIRSTAEPARAASSLQRLLPFRRSSEA